uniref:G_PROTEIN_RECEP_F1_2 domain-containing protein n=1 Tax=Panagrellus redivivus TaxID=6233 RepID=A0A7E4VKN4_PANRE
MLALIASVKPRSIASHFRHFSSFVALNMFYSTASTSVLEFFSKLNLLKMPASKLRATIRQHHEETIGTCEMIQEIQATVPDYKYVIQGPLWRRAICHIGHDLHGHFDPNHVDFELVCGLFHTEKVAFMLPILVGVQSLLMTLMINFLGLKFFTCHALILMPSAGMLWWGIRKNNHRFVWVSFIMTVIIMLGWILSIGFMSYAVYRPQDLIYKLITLMCQSEMMGLQLAILTLILVFALNFYVSVYLSTNILYHAVYMYHMNTNSCCHTSDCPGSKDYDPEWHMTDP